MIFLYIDPGTGSMLFSVVIGLVATLYFLSKAFIIKIKFLITGKGNISKEQRKDIVIFSEDKRYWGVFKPVIDELEALNVPVTYYSQDKDDPFFRENYKLAKGEFIGKGNLGFSKLNILEAKICLMTTPGLDVYQLKRSKGVDYYYHVLHAVDDATSYRLFGLDYFDGVFLTGSYQEAHIRFLEKLRGIREKELVVAGCTYLDSLESRLKNFESGGNETTVLLAPSWGPSGILTKYGESLLTPLADTGFNIIIRPHPQSLISERETIDDLMEKYNGENIKWDFNRENLESLAKASIMISDFSGVIFDYAFLFEKPFIYANCDFDMRPYDAYDVPETPWKFRILSEIGIPLEEKDFCNIKAVIEKGIKSESLNQKIRAAKETAWEHRGEAGKIIADNILKKLEKIN